MSEPTDRHREIATKIVVKYIDRGANKQYVGYVAACLATVCAEERERCVEAIRACPSLDENGYICEKAAAIAKIRSRA
jgi:hypothetical protein